MQFSIFTITLLASIALALAGVVTERGAVTQQDLHTTLYCVDDTPAQSFKVGESVTENNAATVAACTAYKNRNTSTNQWDTFPDFSTSQSGDVTLCNSPAKHLGGDEI